MKFTVSPPRLRDYVLLGFIIKSAYDLSRKIYWDGGIVPFITGLKGGLFRTSLSLLSNIFPDTIGAKISAERSSALKDIEEKFAHSLPASLPHFPSLPKEGLTLAEFESCLAAHLDIPSEQQAQASISGGLCSGAVYGMSDEIQKASLLAIKSFFYSNPLHPDLFPSTRKMEAEIVSMTLDLFTPSSSSSSFSTIPREEVGTVTSGGTESILLACLAYRDWGRKERGVPVNREEIIISNTAHAAFFKAERYFGIKLVVLKPCPTTGKLRASDVRKAITARTVAIVGSAPCFSIGIVDPIEELGKIAQEAGVGLHVDCCLGSYLMPFLDDVPAFDFRVKGVTSISCDPHKYGQTGKGISVLLWKRKDLQHYQYYCQPSWTGGVYASPTLAGSRPGALVAGAWAALLVMGRSGYRSAAEKISSTRKEIINKIKEDPLLSSSIKIVGEPLASVVAFRTVNGVNGGESGDGGETFDEESSVYDLNDSLSRRGWHLNCLQNPAAVHLAITSLTNPVTFISDLKSALLEVVGSDGCVDDGIGGNDGNDGLKTITKSTTTSKTTTKTKTKGSSARIYGTMQQLPEDSLIQEISKDYLDLVYKIK